MERLTEWKDLSGEDFESRLGRLLVWKHGDNLLVVSAKYRGDRGCDFLLKSEGTVIQAYSPQHTALPTRSLVEKVKEKIRSELAKVSKNRAEIEQMLGGKIHKWKLCIPVDPPPEILCYVGQRQRHFDFEIIVQGETHLEELRQRIGFDPNERTWCELREKMSSLDQTSVYGEAVLSKLYVEPSVEAVVPKDKLMSNRKSGHAFEILDEFLSGRDLFEEKSSHQKPLILFSDYGMGKSSCLRMYASTLAKRMSTPFPVFVPLRGALNSKRYTLSDAVDKYLQSEHGISDFKDAFIHRPLCWLFDGFDELNLIELEDDEWIRSRFKEIESFAKRPNSSVILSSRPILFLGKMSNIPDLAPRISLQGFSGDQTRRWISKWKSLPAHHATALSLEGLRDRSLEKECNNPLILFMTASLFDRQLAEPRPYLRAEVFKCFIDNTERGKFSREDDYETVHPLPPNYREVLKEIAVSIFRYGNAGLVSLADLKKRLPEVLHADDVIGEKRLRSLLVGHFFREGSGANAKEYVEFSHQSFREYLIIERIVDLLKALAEGDFDLKRWNRLCEKMLTPAKLRFLRECLCLLDGKTRKSIYEKTVGYLNNQNPFARSLARMDLSPAFCDIVGDCDVLSIYFRILCYYVCSVIASYGSASMRTSLPSPGTSPLCSIYHAANNFPENSQMRKGWAGMLDHMPGGIWGRNMNWQDMALNCKQLSGVAIVQPRAHIVSVNSKRATDCFFSLSNSQAVFLSVENVESLFVEGGTVLVGNQQTTFKNCVLSRCRLVGISEKMSTTFKNCRLPGVKVLNKITEEGGEWIDSGVPDDGLSDALSKVQETLESYLKEVPCAPLVPWRNIVAERIPKIETVLFGSQERNETDVDFTDYCRTVAISREELSTET